FLRLPPHPSSSLFPYTTLFRSSHVTDQAQRRDLQIRVNISGLGIGDQQHVALMDLLVTADAGSIEANSISKQVLIEVLRRNRKIDRKSTRLNSSHVSISYAVFC